MLVSPSVFAESWRHVLDFEDNSKDITYSLDTESITQQDTVVSYRVRQELTMHEGQHYDTTFLQETNCLTNEVRILEQRQWPSGELMEDYRAFTRWMYPISTVAAGQINEIICKEYYRP
jgi:hypothetical protein